jgi:hypothetical protein
MRNAESHEKVVVCGGKVVRIEKWSKMGRQPIKTFEIAREGNDFKFLVGQEQSSKGKRYSLDTIAAMFNRDGDRYRRIFSLEKATEVSIRGPEVAWQFEVVHQ